MNGTPTGADLERLLAERGTQLMRVAMRWPAADQDGEDLLQAGLERVLRNRGGGRDTEGYLRQVLYNLAADGWRRRGRWRHDCRSAAQATSQATARQRRAAVDLRDALVRLLRQLPPRQRAVIVLRYWEQRTQAETARAARLLGRHGQVGRVTGAAAAARTGRDPHRPGLRARGGNVMSTDLQDLLREGLDRLTADAACRTGWSAGPAAQPAAPIRIRAAIAAGTAVAAAAAAVTVSLTATGTSRATPRCARRPSPTWSPAPSGRWPPRGSGQRHPGDRESGPGVTFRLSRSARRARSSTHRPAQCCPGRAAT